VLVFLCFFDNIIMSIASTLGLAEVFQKYWQTIKNHDTLISKRISIMIHFGDCIKYRYHDTILNQVLDQYRDTI